MVNSRHCLWHLCIPSYSLRSNHYGTICCFFQYLTTQDPASTYSFCAYTHYYLKPNHYLKFPCLYPATIWNPATIYNFWSVPNYLRLSHCLLGQFLCHYQTKTQPLFTASVLVPSYYLSSKYYLQFLWWYTTGNYLQFFISSGLLFYTQSLFIIYMLICGYCHGHDHFL
jgi:hypothetical protein